jgi:hypothetical protein
MGNFENVGTPLGSQQVSGGGGEDSREGRSDAEGGGSSSNFWGYSIDHERLERDIQRLQNADLDTVSQLPPEHLLGVIRELAAERKKLIEYRVRKSQIKQDSSQQSPSQQNPACPSPSSPASSQPARYQPAPSQQTQSCQGSSQSQSSPSQWQEIVQDQSRSAIQADQVRPPRSHKAEVRPCHFYIFSLIFV